MSNLSSLSAAPHAESGDVLVAAEAVSKTFTLPDRQLPVLEDITISVASGELVTIVGASGCGKTTLLKVLGGLLLPSGGTVRIDGKIMDAPRPDTVGVVFQEDGLLPWYRLERNVALGLAARRVNREERRRRVARILETVGLAEFGRAHPRELSGGMRQRAALARALVLEPRVLLLDEPFAALDEQTRNLMGQELRALHSKVGGAMIMVTHSLTEAVLLSDRVIALSSRPGRVRRELVIDLPAERSVDLIDSAEFAELRSELWRELEGEWARSWNVDNT